MRISPWTLARRGLRTAAESQSPGGKTVILSEYKKAVGHLKKAKLRASDYADLIAGELKNKVVDARVRKELVKLTAAATPPLTRKTEALVQRTFDRMLKAGDFAKGGKAQLPKSQQFEYFTVKQNFNRIRFPSVIRHQAADYWVALVPRGTDRRGQDPNKADHFFVVHYPANEHARPLGVWRVGMASHPHPTSARNRR